MAELLADKHAFYIAMTYGATFLYIVIELILLTRSKQSLLKRITRMGRLKERN
ncbi:MAG: heme exporter protein CcmD [Candidatus Heimdallarchaeota archaeon]|nr:heme exporter protein CcmD [Gammaproteobacteria bacterium]MDH5647720.1 heme exporter protein CcmD [Candidatus Heimdallarchaeota archaeon]MDH5730890.1 heme exporter protein CcmD [Gammaproteobacteria bacterium]